MTVEERNDLHLIHLIYLVVQYLVERSQRLFTGNTIFFNSYYYTLPEVEDY